MANGYSNWKSGIWTGDSIPHYYGDWVRGTFILMAVLSFVATPLWGDLLPFGIFAQVGAAILLVLLAGLTTAKNQLVMLANATISGISILLLQSYAMMTHATQTSQLFLAREAGVLLMITSFYFSVKTLRGMMSGKIGHQDSPLEFDDVVSVIETEEVYPAADRTSYDGQ